MKDSTHGSGYLIHGISLLLPSSSSSTLNVSGRTHDFFPQISSGIAFNILRRNVDFGDTVEEVSAGSSHFGGPTEVSWQSCESCQEVAFSTEDKQNFATSFRDINKAFDQAGVYGLPPPGEKVRKSQLYTKRYGGLLVAEDVDIDFLRFVERYLFSVFKLLLVQQNPSIKLPDEGPDILSPGKSTRRGDNFHPSGFPLEVFAEVMPTLVKLHENPQTFNTSMVRELMELELGKSLGRKWAIQKRSLREREISSFWFSSLSYTRCCLLICE